MSNRDADALSRAKRQTKAGGKGPLWSLVFESLIRGVTATVVLLLLFILSTIIWEGGPQVIGIQKNTAFLVQGPDSETGSPVIDNRLLVLDDATADPGKVMQTNLEEPAASALQERTGLVFTKHGAAVVIPEWDHAVVDGALIENKGGNRMVTQFDDALVDDAIRIYAYHPHPNLSFLTEPPRDGMKAGGIFPALFGTVFLILFMILMALPLGVFAAIFMVEYAHGGIGSRIIRAAVNNLAGVPSIVFGLFGLGFFVLFVGRNLDYYAFGIPRDSKERSVLEARIDADHMKAEADADAQHLSGNARDAYIQQRDAHAPQLHAKVFGQGAMFWAAATLAILVLPVIIVSTEEALRAVPGSLREAAYGLGATKWQVVSTVVIPQARSGILTGAILALGRGAGELAPILFVGVTFFAPTLPLTEPINFFGLFHLPVVNPFKEFMHLNYHIYTMATQHPDPVATRAIQFGTTLVLVGMTFLMNLVAIALRRRYSR